MRRKGNTANHTNAGNEHPTGFSALWLERDSRTAIIARPQSLPAGFQHRADVTHLQNMCPLSERYRFSRTQSMLACTAAMSSEISSKARIGRSHFMNSTFIYWP